MKTKTMDQKEILRTDIPTWFSLSYANYLVLQRALLESMPLDWQYKFVDLLEELDEHFGYPDLPTRIFVKVRMRNDKGQFIKDPVPHYRHAPKLTKKDFKSWMNT